VRFQLFAHPEGDPFGPIQRLDVGDRQAGRSGLDDRPFELNGRGATGQQVQQ
jgi:hypothetical protein